MAGAAPVGAYPSPILVPTAWDSLTINGVVWNGKVKIRGAKRSYRWQVKEPNGQDGQTVTYRGKNAKKFKIEIYLWTDFHFTAWPAFSLLFQYPAAKAGVVMPITIYHPSLALLGIQAVTCEELGPPEEISEDHMFRAEIEVREFIPQLPIPVTNTPSGAAAVSPPHIPGIPVNPVIAALEDQIEALQRQAANLGTPGGLPR